MTLALIACIRAYQRLTRSLVACGFGPLTLSGCRQWPTCSEYGIAVLTQHGVVRGLPRAVWRVLTCNPLTS